MPWLPRSRICDARQQLGKCAGKADLRLGGTHLLQEVPEPGTLALLGTAQGSFPPIAVKARASEGIEVGVMLPSALGGVPAFFGFRHGRRSAEGSMLPDYRSAAAGEGLWFYASVAYRDFMDEPHVANFCWRWEPVFGGISYRFVVPNDAPAAYVTKA